VTKLGARGERAESEGGTRRVGQKFTSRVRLLSEHAPGVNYFSPGAAVASRRCVVCIYTCTYNTYTYVHAYIRNPKSLLASPSVSRLEGVTYGYRCESSPRLPFRGVRLPLPSRLTRLIKSFSLMETYVIAASRCSRSASFRSRRTEERPLRKRWRLFVNLAETPRCKGEREGRVGGGGGGGGAAG
jgi:hypothetical protein